MKPEQINKIIHERVRLSVMSVLAARGKITFTELKSLLNVTDGNLSVHTSILEKHNLIKIKKEFAGKKPRTTFIITQKGRDEFKNYVNELENILKLGE